MYKINLFEYSCEYTMHKIIDVVIGLVGETFSMQHSTSSLEDS